MAANVQAGANNNQTVGPSQTVDQAIRDSVVRTVEQSTGSTQLRTETVEVVNISNIDWWVIILLILFAGVLIPSPAEIYRKLFNRK